jgi:hypothetical protein
LTASIKEIVYYARVFWIGGALKVVDPEVEHLPLPLEFGRDYVAKFLGSLARALRGAFDVYAMFVAAGGEHGIIALHALKPFDEVGHDGGIGVADMRRGVDVVYRSGQVVFIHFKFFK